MNIFKGLLKKKVKSKSLNPKHKQIDRFKHYLKMAKFYNNKTK